MIDKEQTGKILEAIKSEMRQLEEDRLAISEQLSNPDTPSQDYDEKLLYLEYEIILNKLYLAQIKRKRHFWSILDYSKIPYGEEKNPYIALKTYANMNPEQRERAYTADPSLTDIAYSDELCKRATQYLTRKKVLDDRLHNLLSQEKKDEMLALKAEALALLDEAEYIVTEYQACHIKARDSYVEKNKNST